MKAKPSTYRVCCEKKNFEFEVMSAMEAFGACAAVDYIDRGLIVWGSWGEHVFCAYAYRISTEALNDNRN